MASEDPKLPTSKDGTEVEGAAHILRWGGMKKGKKRFDGPSIKTGALLMELKKDEQEVTER